MAKEKIWMLELPSLEFNSLLCHQLFWDISCLSYKIGIVIATPWTVSYQAPPSMGFSRQNTGVGCHFLLQKEKYSTMLIFGKYGLWKYSAVIVVFFWFFYVLAIYQNKEWNNAICSNVDGLGDCCTWWNKSDKDKYHVISLVVESKKLMWMNLFTNQIDS